MKCAICKKKIVDRNYQAFINDTVHNKCLKQYKERESGISKARSPLQTGEARKKRV